MNRIFTLIFLLVAATASCQIPTSGLFKEFKEFNSEPQAFNHVFYQNQSIYALTFPQNSLVRFDMVSHRFALYRPFTGIYTEIDKILPIGDSELAIIKRDSFYFKDAAGQEHISELSRVGMGRSNMVVDTAGDLILYDSDSKIYKLDRITGLLALTDSLKPSIGYSTTILCGADNSKYFVDYQSVTKDSTVLPFSPNARIESALIDSFNNLWVIDNDTIRKWDGTQMENFIPAAIGFSVVLNYRLVHGRQGYVYVISQSGEIMEYNGTGWSFLVSGFDIGWGAKGTLDGNRDLWIFNDSIYHLGTLVSEVYSIKTEKVSDIAAVGYNGRTAYLGLENGFYYKNINDQEFFNTSIGSKAIGKVNCFSENMQVESSGNPFLLLGSDNGFFIIDERNMNKSWHYDTTGGFLLNDTVTAVSFYWDSTSSNYDDTSSFAIGTKGGLSVKTKNGWKKYNTANSPLPSDNITCLAKWGSRLYIGTDSGLAILYASGNWEVYDSSRVGKRLYVNDVYPLSNYPFNSNLAGIYISTMGQGLYVFKQDSLLSFAFSAIADCNDTVYFVRRVILDKANLGYCLVAGFQGCGILIQDMSDTLSAAYYNSGFTTAYKIAVQICSTWECPSYALMLTDSGLYYSTYGMASIPEIADNKAQFKLYPNPANDLCTIALDEHANAEYTIADVTGRQVLQGMAAQGKVSIDISNLSPGVYLVQVNDNGKSLGVRRLLVE